MIGYVRGRIIENGCRESCWRPFEWQDRGCVSLHVTASTQWQAQELPGVQYSSGARRSIGSKAALITSRGCRFLEHVAAAFIGSIMAGTGVARGTSELYTKQHWFKGGDKKLISHHVCRFLEHVAAFIHWLNHGGHRSCQEYSRALHEAALVHTRRE